MLTTRARITTAALLIISAAAFATGAAIERGSTRSETHANPSHTGAAVSARPDASPSARSSAVSPVATAPSKQAPAPSPTPKASGGDGDNGETSPIPKTTQPPTTRTPTPTPTATPSATGDGDGGESTPATPGASTTETGHSEVGENPATHSAEVSSETLLGVNPEAPALVAVAVLLSLGFAALILTVRSRAIAVAIAATMLVFTALDIREVVHQVNESRTGLALLAAFVALLHLGAAIAAAWVSREPSPVTAEVPPT